MLHFSSLQTTSTLSKQGPQHLNPLLWYDVHGSRKQTKQKAWYRGILLEVEFSEDGQTTVAA